MNVPTGVLPIPSRSSERQSRWPLALLATLSLALVLGVVAVVLVPGGQLKRSSSGLPTIRSRRRQAHLRRRASSRQHAQGLGRSEQLQGQGHVLCHRTTGATHPRLVEREYREGHSVQNHTYTHPDLTTLGPVETRRELRATNRAIKAAGVPKPYRFRPPYGHTNARVRNIGASLGLIQTLWSGSSRPANPPAL